MSSYYPLEIPRCEQIKDNGVRCGAPALRGKTFCYHHNDLHARRLRPGHKGYTFRPVETPETVTMQAADVAQAAHDGTISLQLARVLLYAIQIGAQQMRRVGTHCRDVETEVPEAMKAPDEQIIEPSGHLAASSSEETSSQSPASCESAIEANQSPINNSAEATNDVDTSKSDQPISGLSEHQVNADDAEPGEETPSPTNAEDGGPTEDEVIRKSIFHPDPEKVRAYWLQHLPPEIADLRCPSGELVYTPPEWLPLTEEQLAYLRERMGPDCGTRSPEEQENLDRMNLHCTHMMVEPPKPEKVIKCYNDLWNGEKMWEEFDAQVRKDPKAAVKLLLQQVQGA